MEKKNNFTTIIIMFVSIVILVFISFILGTMINKFYSNEKSVNESSLKSDNSNDNKYESPYAHVSIDINKMEVKKEKDNEATKNIEVEKVFYNSKSHTNKVLVLVKNNNDYAVELKGAFNYYDKDGYNIDQNYDSLSVVYPKTEAVLAISLVALTEDFKSYDFTFYANKVKSYYEIVNIKNSDLDITKTSSEIIATYKNDTGKDIFNIELVCLYYKNNDLVMIQDGAILNASNGLSGNYSFYNSSIGEEYDDYKIVVTSAYIYSKEW